MLLRMDSPFEVEEFGGNSILYFSADWCGPCKILTPALERLSEEEPYSEVTFFQVPAETNHEMFDRYEVTNHPVLFLMRNGKIVARFQGVMDMENQAEKDINRLKKLIKALYGVK